MRQTVTHRPSQPNLVVGWASGLLQVWPAEDHTITLRPSAAPALRHAEEDVEAARLAS